MIDEVPIRVYKAAVFKIEGLKVRTELYNNSVRAVDGLIFRGLDHDSVVAEFRSAVKWLKLGIRSYHANFSNYVARRGLGEEISSSI